MVFLWAGSVYYFFEVHIRIRIRGSDPDLANLNMDPLMWYLASRGFGSVRGFLECRIRICFFLSDLDLIFSEGSG